MKEENKLIALFMGGNFKVITFQTPYGEETYDEWYGVEGIPPQTGWAIAASGEYPYDSSWDWLMPVVEKIGALPGINVNISSFDGCSIYDDNYKHTAQGMIISVGLDRSIPLMNAIYTAVVAFINWYNKNKIV